MLYPEHSKKGKRLNIKKAFKVRVPVWWIVVGGILVKIALVYYAPLYVTIGASILGTSFGIYRFATRHRRCQHCGKLQPKEETTKVPTQPKVAQSRILDHPSCVSRDRFAPIVCCNCGFDLQQAA